MPLVLVDTNLKAGELPGDFLPRVNKTVAEILDKPEHVVTIRVKTDQLLMSGKTTDPMALVQIMAMDRFNPESNKIYGPKLQDFFTTTLGLPSARVLVLLSPIESHQIPH